MSAKETMIKVITTHNLMHLATIDSKGFPHVRGVDYAYGEKADILYFITQKTSRKVEHLSHNNQIAIVIDSDCPNWEDLSQVKYIKATGTASIIKTAREMQKASGLLIKKFPFLANLPGDPSDFVGIRVELKEVLVTDNTISFGNTEKILF
ncbi:MAG: pyridoxamine 5'-phosphate oxidase family protein [Desulfobacula sp.]|nr:pyridoxamine 5'-phosphate oxidase family protein [Desulfobacula sp.]